MLQRREVPGGIVVDQVDADPDLFLADGLVIGCSSCETAAELVASSGGWSWLRQREPLDVARGRRLCRCCLPWAEVDEVVHAVARQLGSRGGRPLVLRPILRRRIAAMMREKGRIA